MRKIEIIADVRTRLTEQGFGGLFNDGGPCSCSLDQLAACGECNIEVTGAESSTPEAEEWINGCQAGYVHLDLRPGYVELGGYVVTSEKEAPLPEYFDDFYPKS